LRFSLQNTTSTSSLNLDWLLLEGRRFRCLLACMELGQECCAGLFHVEAGLVQPRVGLKLVNCVAVRAIVAEELEDHVLEVS